MLLVASELGAKISKLLAISTKFLRVRDKIELSGSFRNLDSRHATVDKKEKERDTGYNQYIVFLKSFVLDSQKVRSIFSFSFLLA